MAQQSVAHAPQSAGQTLHPSSGVQAPLPEAETPRVCAMAASVVPPLGPRTLVAVAAVTWVVAVVAAAAFPWAFPVLVLVIVSPLVLAIPYVDQI